MSNRKIRVLLAKPGLDGHDRGVKVVARALRDSGMEVIYAGLRQTPDMIVESAIQEDVDVVGLSILSGAHMALLPLIAQKLKEADLEHVIIVAGGIIPDEDFNPLKEAGVHKVFTPGTPTAEIIDFIKQNVSLN